MTLLSLLIGACSTVPAVASADSSPSKSTLLSSPSSSNTFVAPVTQKVFMNVRISRSDGTFYVRDEVEGDENDQVLYARLVIGLFGTVAPVHVQRFLSFIPGGTATTTTTKTLSREDDLDDTLSLPSYAQSSFPSLDQATGLLSAGVIPALHVTEFNGASALQYGERLLPAPLWIEQKSSTSSSADRVSHALPVKGLLTHRQLDVTPAFQITTRIVDADTARELDATHVVFGQVVLWDASDKLALDFFRRLQDIPTYSESRPVVSTTMSTSSSSSSQPPAGESTVVLDAMTSSLYRAQRDFFRGAAQTLGDQRLNNVYQGKFLRRVEVTQIGLLDA